MHAPRTRNGIGCFSTTPLRIAFIRNSIMRSSPTSPLPLRAQAFCRHRAGHGKAAAQRAGIGWQGKHTNLVSRNFGSWLFLGEIYLMLALEARSGRARPLRLVPALSRHLPDAAFPAPYRLDARRCISYLTIEHKGTIPLDFAPRSATASMAAMTASRSARGTNSRNDGEPDFLPRDELTAPRLADLAALDDAAFRRLFAGSPVKRIGRDRFVRNVLIAIGNMPPGRCRRSPRGATLPRRWRTAGPRRRGLGFCPAGSAGAVPGRAHPSAGSRARPRCLRGMAARSGPTLSRGRRAMVAPAAFARHTTLAIKRRNPGCEFFLPVR